MWYNIDTKMDFYRLEIEALRHFLEMPCKTFTLMKDYTMKLIKDLGIIKRPQDKASAHRAIFECPDCMNTFTLKFASKSKRCKSCNGKTQNTTHGLHKTRIYRIWQAIKARTSNPNNTKYELYKDKKPPTKWNTFEGFYEDMKEGYSDSLSIDRIDNSMPYSKDNCRWVDSFVQAQNKGIFATNKSGYTGVYKLKTKNGYQSGISYNGKQHYLGLYKTAKEAAMARDNFIIKNKTAHILSGIKRTDYGNNTD